MHRLIAGDAALDFANTLNGHNRPQGHEYLKDFRDLALWCRHSGIFGTAETQRLLKSAAKRPVQARQLYRRSLKLRELIFRIFHAIAVGSRPSAADLGLLNAAWKDAQSHAKIGPSLNRFSLRWDADAGLESIPRILSSAAVNTLVSGKTVRVKACAGDGCDWLFLDSSRNHLRRWCSMDECGNRAKMRRRQQRKVTTESNRKSRRETTARPGH